jgi:hypothetical protein
MPDMQFDDTKSFDHNLELFLTHMDAVDADLGTILRTHVDKLKGALDDSTRRDARTLFNEGIVASLDELVPDEDDKNE